VIVYTCLVINDVATIQSEMTTETVPGSMVLLTQLQKQMLRKVSEEALGMRFKHYFVLSQLLDRPVVTQQALGESLCMDPNNLVILLNDVEASGCLERRRDPADRRRHLVEITDGGREAVARAERALEDVEHEVLATLSDKERATLHRLLDKALE
jgi:DNA-binding MarR family transcriptional regulator